MPTYAKTNTGRNAVRDFLANHIEELALGTGTTDPQSTDTSLESEVISKAVSVENGGDGEVTFSVRLATTEANGTDLTELASKDGDGDVEDRITFAEIPKTDNFEIEFRLTQTVVNT